MPSILGANTLSSGYDVANSVRFDRASTDNLSRTKGTSDSTTIGTYSFWFKLSKISGSTLIENGTGAADRAIVYIDSNSKLKIFSKIGNSTKLDLGTNRVFRDTSAWYHLVIAIDTTDGTASNRVKVYVNGVQETSFASSTYPDQNDALRFFTSSEVEEIGIDFENGGLFDGYMCEVVKVDGSQLAPTSFGEFDEDSGIWKPIDVSGLTFGTNGFYLDFEDSANLGNDANGGTDFTENNITAVDQSTDTCTNNFATLNSLRNQVHTLSEGNLEYTATTSTWNGVFSTIGVSTGKWYCEVKYSSLDGSTFRFYTGIADARDFDTVHKVGQNETGRVGDTIGFLPDASSPDVLKNGSDAGGSWSTMSVNDILGIAIDCDNGALYFSKNGTWENSSDPESGASKTGAITFTVGETYLFGFGTYGDSSPQQQVNFGSPIHSISSGNADGDGYGNFEYAVPSGYYSLNTKNLAEYG